MTDPITVGFLAPSNHRPDQQNSGSSGGNEPKHSNESDDEPIEPSNDKVGSDTTLIDKLIPRSRFRREQNKVKK